MEKLIQHPSWIEIDVAQFKRNLSAVRKKIGGRRFCLTVKANAYGHGLCEMGSIAQEMKIDYLGVSCLKEGIILRKSGVNLPIFVFGAIHEEQIQEFIAWELEFSVSSRFKAELVAKVCERLVRKCRIHLEVDTGMQRTGMRSETALELLSWIETVSCFDLVGVYSHLATADKPHCPVALEQIRQFRQLRERSGRKDLIWHLANSGGIVFYPDSYLDMVRPGLLCYGYFPDGRRDIQREIAPCFSLKAKISYFKVVGSGEGISYGHSYRTISQTRIVTIPIGYGDGYGRIFSNRGFVLIRGRKYLISGTICMDQLMVDIGQNEAYVGDEVVLIGAQGNDKIDLNEISEIANTIPYEILCSLNNRLNRIYK